MEKDEIAKTIKLMNITKTLTPVNDPKRRSIVLFIICRFE
jgi:hypothetical protein